MTIKVAIRTILLKHQIPKEWNSDLKDIINENNQSTNDKRANTINVTNEDNQNNSDIVNKIKSIESDAKANDMSCIID